MKNIQNVISIVLIIILIFFIWDKLNTDDSVIEVPVIIEVPVPIVENYTDTIYKPKPIYINNPLDKELIAENKDLIDKFKKADSLLKLKQYQDAIAINEYKEEYIDTFQTITIYTKTRGELLEQYAHYKTKPYNIKLDTTVKVKVKNKFKVFGLIEGGSNIIDENSFSQVVGKGTVIFKNSKDNGISLGIDTQGYGYLGYMFKF